MTSAPLPHQQLRAATQACHDEVDSAYGRFDLGDRQSYANFLTAHARALPGLETALVAVPGLPSVQPRTPLLMQDLATLGVTPPKALPAPAVLSSPAAWAGLYVVEGSRLGGIMLARSVGADLPKAYLSAGHGRGGWRALLAAFDEAADGEEWMAEAIASAEAVFALYARSAGPDRTGISQA